VMENRGVNIDFTSGFPSMSMHYLGADSGNCVVDEASQNLGGQKAGSDKWAFSILRIPSLICSDS
jgi:hypothetical protein